MKDQARPRYKAVIEKAGLDFDLIMEDDSNEVTKLAIWSYLQLEASLNKNRVPLLSDKSAYKDDPGSAETGSAEPDNRTLEVRKDSEVIKPTLFDDMSTDTSQSFVNITLSLFICK
jgi:hypothetical protein